MTNNVPICKEITKNQNLSLKNNINEQQRTSF